MSKTTKKDFELFKSECRKWIKEFELSNYRINFYWSNEFPDCAAWLYRNIDNADIKVYFTKKYHDFDLNDEKIKIHAKHEMIHVLLSELSELGCDRFVTKKEIFKVEEQLVRKLSKII